MAIVGELFVFQHNPFSITEDDALHEPNTSNTSVENGQEISDGALFFS